MHLQQTKGGSRATGGPQYYFHDVPAHVKDFLRKRHACSVLLCTPYGLARSPFMAVDKDHKLTPSGRVVAGSVGHDRVQMASGHESIGEAIRKWYAIEPGHDFERIDVEAELHEDHFILIPTAARMRGRRRAIPLERQESPLSFHDGHQSRLWRQQIEAVRQRCPEHVDWASRQLQTIVAEHREPNAAHISEADLLRSSGAFSRLGLFLSPYLGKGYDCARTRFQFLSFPAYDCPVEIKKRSRGFKYQVTQYAQLPRAVVLCMKHDYVNMPRHIDVIELPVLAKHLVR